MFLIRVCKEARLPKWDANGDGDADLAKTWLAPDRDPNVSAFVADSALDEVEAAAAYVLTDLQQSLDALWVLRMALDDLRAIGAPMPASNWGTTGVVAIDFRHRELCGADLYAVELMRRLRERLEAGEDRLRRIGVEPLRRQLRRFLDREDGLVIAEAKRRCHEKLTRKGTLSRPKKPQLEEQLNARPPKVPEDIIRLKAYYRSLQGPEKDSQTNWLEAEQSIRTEYAQGVLRLA